MRATPVNRPREREEDPRRLPDHVSAAVFGFATGGDFPMTIVFRAAVRAGLGEAVVETCRAHPRACEALLMTLYEYPRFVTGIRLGETEDGVIAIDVPEDLRGGADHD